MDIKVALELQPCCGQRSGIGTYTYELARRLNDIEEISFRGNLFNYLMRNNNASDLQGVSIPIDYNKSMPYGVYRRLWDILPLNYFEMFPNGADITHFFNYIVPPGVKGKIIDSVYDLVFLRYPETMDARNLRRIKKGLSYSLDRSDAIITDSIFIKEEIIQEFRMDPEKVHVIYPAASIADTDITMPYLTKKWHIIAPYVLYVGNIEPRKNLNRLINAYNKLRAEMPGRIQMVLVGGKGWRSEEIYKAAEESKYSDDIIFTGYVSADEKSALYRNAELFVYPSIYEGFGIPVLEAMVCSKPIVCSNVSSLPEVVGSNAFLADPFNEADIAEKLVEALTNKELAGRMAALAKVRTGDFSWEKSAEKLINLYKSMG